MRRLLLDTNSLTIQTFQYDDGTITDTTRAYFIQCKHCHYCWLGIANTDDPVLKNLACPSCLEDQGFSMPMNDWCEIIRYDSQYTTEDVAMMFYRLTLCHLNTGGR